MSADYKYDLAISFLQEDEALAMDIADRIGDRLAVDVFVYSKRQDELVGREGLEAFSGIFGRQSRIVVVLHREAWGNTLWTRAEETAIKNRAYQDGAEFLLLIPLDRSPLPDWVPITHLYLGIEKYGIDGAASAAEEMVRRAGGIVRSESAFDYAGRVARKVDFEREREGWYNSAKGVEEATAEARTVLNEIEAIGNRIKEELPGLKIRVESRWDRQNIVASEDYGLVILWDTNSGINSLRNFRLTAKLYRGFVTFRQILFVDRPEELQENKYDPDIDRSLTPGWREGNGERKFLTSKQLVDACVKRLLELIDQH
ncbi:MAG: hypothetical protein WAU45_17020 [Blastocatellia bacterium]